MVQARQIRANDINPTPKPSARFPGGDGLIHQGGRASRVGGGLSRDPWEMDQTIANSSAGGTIEGEGEHTEKHKEEYGEE